MAGLPVPETVSTPAGRAFIEKDGHFYMLSRFVEGRLYPPGTMPSRAARRMGEMHARLLDALSDLPPDDVPPLPEPTWIEEHLRRLLSIAETRRACDPVDERACGILEQKLRLLREVSGPPAFAWQWTHGDYEWRNVLFNEEDEVIAVLDFDNLVYYGRERDVMRCIALTFPAGAPEAAAFFAGYAAQSGLTADEARNYIWTYRYFSTFRTWPISARYLEPANYLSRWDDLIEAGPEISWQWDDLADRFAAVAANLVGRSD